MEKGTFAKYKNKIFRVSNIDGDNIRWLVSEDLADLNNGFKEKLYSLKIVPISPACILRKLRKKRLTKFLKLITKQDKKGIYSI